MIFNQKWIGYRVHNGEKSAPFNVEVPGNIQYDYGVANNFKDVYFLDGCRQYEQLENDEWVYSTTLNYERAKNEKVFFVSGGIDYKYEIYLNDKLIFENEGMFSPIEIDLTPKLASNLDCKDVLTVKIAPHPKREGAPYGRTQADHSTKPPVCYGWDWNPRLLVSGIHTNTYIETRGKGYINNPEINYTLSEDFSLASVSAIFDCDSTCTITLIDNQGNVVYKGTDKNFIVKNPKLWWCNGEGEPTLYAWFIENEYSKKTGKIGFRKAKLVKNVGDRIDSKFPLGCENAPITIELNGRRIFMKGSNFVNPDIFPARVTKERYKRLIELAKNANMNIFRMWGGSGPMHKCFYEICDELGIMVWQEFMLSCNKYPDDEHYLLVLEREATSIIRSLRSHACLVLWGGGNELFNRWSGMDEQSLPLRLLDKLCYELDRAHPFIKTSPIKGMAHGGYAFYDEERMSGDVFSEFQNASNTAYTEFGVPSIAPLDVLKRIIPEDEIFPITDTTAYVLHHAKNAWGVESWACVDVLEKYFGKATCIEDLVYQSNWLQCEGYKNAFEEMRRQWPRCSGAINWVYNEPWYTAANNSVLVYPETPKPSYNAIKSALRSVIFSARILKFDWKENEKFKAEIWLLNDSNNATIKNAKVYLKIGNEKIILLDKISAKSDAKTNVECASVCCVLPFIENVDKMYLIIESDEFSSNEYCLKYDTTTKKQQPKEMVKKLND